MKLTKILWSAEEAVDPSVNLNGWRKYYTSHTNQVRFNVGASTMAMMGITILYFALRPKKKAIDNKKK